MVTGTATESRYTHTSVRQPQPGGMGGARRGWRVCLQMQMRTNARVICERPRRAREHALQLQHTINNVSEPDRANVSLIRCTEFTRAGCLGGFNGDNGKKCAAHTFTCHDADTHERTVNQLIFKTNIMQESGARGPVAECG